MAVLLEIYILKPDIYKLLREAKVRFAGSRRLAFESELLRLMTLTPVVKLLSQQSFFYASAREEFRAFLAFDVSDKAFYRGLGERLKSSSVPSFYSFLLTFGAGKEYDFLVLCGRLAEFVEYHTIYSGDVWKGRSAGRIAAGVRPKERIAQLIRFKENGNDLGAITALTVKNAIRFFLAPEECVPILSEKHRKQVFQYILSKEYKGERSMWNVFEFFKKLKVRCHNPQNNGVLYRFIFYSPEIKPLWSEEERLPYQIAGRLAEGKEALSIGMANLLIRECRQKKLKKLDLGCCGLTDLSKLPELFECGHIEELILSNEWAEYDKEQRRWKKCRSGNAGEKNMLSSLPARLGVLKQLKRLVCGGDWKEGKRWDRWGIGSAEAISKLENLEFLNLSNNGLKHLEGFERLKKLKVVHLNNNFIFSIEPLKGLEALEDVYLSDNEIENLTPLKKMGRIRTLDLHANRVRDIRPLERLIARLGIENTKWRLNTVNVAQNPLEKPPMEVVMTGKDAVLQYFKDIKLAGTYVNRDVKVILVGNSEVGKTTLAKYLDGEKGLGEPHPASHWMEHRMVKSKCVVKRLGEPCVIHLFDFGGHDYFHDTHHMFYSANTLYVLLWDKETNFLNLRKMEQEDYKRKRVTVQTQDYPIRYWLESVKHYVKNVEADNFDVQMQKGESYNSSLLVVQNKVGEAGGIVRLNHELFCAKFPFIFDFINVDIEKKRNMAHFDELFGEMLEGMQVVGAEMPKFYQVVKESLDAYTGEPIVSLEEFGSYCRELLGKEISREQVRFLADYLKQIGTILWFSDAGGDKVCLNRKWVIDRIYKVLYGLPKRRGEFDMKYVEEALKDEKGEEAYAGKLIEIMTGFKMIFRHPCADMYIAPLYLPKMPERTVDLFLSRELVPCRRIEFTGFIHKCVVLQFFQEYGAFVTDDGLNVNEGRFYYWKDGLIVKDPESEDVVMIRFNLGTDEGNAFIDIFSVKAHPGEAFARRVLDDLRTINKGYETEEMVTLDGVDFVSVEVLEENARQGRLVFTGQRRGDEVKVSGNELKYYKLNDYRMFLKGGVKKKKVVISYSKRDLRSVHLLVHYLRPLVDDGLIEEPWFCENLPVSREWDGEIKERFTEADVVFFMVSPFFYSTDYIVENEIKTIIDRYDKDRSVKIVPIVLEFYNWGRKEPYNLKRFTALPFQAKPVSDFSNPKMAWYMIGEAVRMMIEKDLDPANKVLVSREIQDLHERQVGGRLDRNSD